MDIRAGEHSGPLMQFTEEEFLNGERFLFVGDCRGYHRMSLLDVCSISTCDNQTCLQSF